MKSTHRRSKETDGLVNFPIDSSDWTDSGEGGMAVYLVTYDHPCICIPGVGCFVYADIAINEGALRGSWAAFSATSDPEKDAEKERLYWMEGDHVTGFVYLGSTGASLWSERLGRYWTATEDDLTDEGKQLYNTMWGLYAGSAPVIVTCLDT